MSAAEEETLNPNVHFDNFKDPKGGLRVDLIFANLVYLLQSDKDTKWTLDKYLEYCEDMWRHIDKVEKVSIYQ